MKVDSTIKPEEVAQFDQLASDWWDPNGSMKPLHQMNPIRLQYIQNHTQITNKQWLDVGCGGGLLSESLAKQGASVTGVDASSELINTAKTHATNSNLNINYQNLTLSALPTTTTYDCISCMELLEHVAEPNTLIQQCADRLKPGGELFLSTLNRHWKAFALGIVAAEYIMRLIPRGTHKYQQFIRPSELEKWLESAGLKLHDIAGMQYHPLSQQFTLNQDVSINYIIYCKKL